MLFFSHADVISVEDCTWQSGNRRGNQLQWGHYQKTMMNEAHQNLHFLYFVHYVLPPTLGDLYYACILCRGKIRFDEKPFIPLCHDENPFHSSLVSERSINL